MGRRVIIESPYAGDVENNLAYARACVRDSILVHHESPIAFHIHTTQVLDDTDPEERQIGMMRAQDWYSVAEAVVVYTDRGMSKGMQAGMECAQYWGIPIVYRELGHK